MDSPYVKKTTPTISRVGISINILAFVVGIGPSIISFWNNSPIQHTSTEATWNAVILESGLILAFCAIGVSCFANIRASGEKRQNVTNIMFSLLLLFIIGALWVLEVLFYGGFNQIG